MNIEATIGRSFATFLSSPGFFHDLIMTAVLLVLLIILRKIFNKSVESWKGLSIDNRRKLFVTSRNFVVITFIIGVFIIWGHQIKEFAIGVAAVAVAFVMCFKEIIANFMGGVNRALSHEFGIGDRIKIGELRGDVIDTDMLSTTILEIGPGSTTHQYTGSSIVIPNTLLLNQPVINESFMQEYLLHVFKVPVALNDGWRRKEHLLMQAACIICEPYLNKARNYMEGAASKLSFDPPSTDPRISIVFDSPEKINLIVRVPVPSRRKGRVEQEIIRKYLELLDEEQL